jgi:aspartyl-tRNA(Asn)/glutamyl-tRNA(Gln) amidotransferase subunit B
MKMLEEGSVNSRIAKDLIKEFILIENSDPKKIASDRGLLQSSDTGALKTVVDEVMAENPQVVLDIKDGKTNLIQFLIGQAMKKTKGSANPAVLTTLFSEALK